MKNLKMGLVMAFSIMGAAFNAGAAPSVDCSAAYGKAVQCEIVTCNDKQMTFLGTWKGTFQSYSRELSTREKTVFRPFQNEVVYTPNDCLRNPENGDTFIIGHRTDTYSEFMGLPAQTKSGLLITGNRADGTPFLRTVDGDGINDYKLQYQNAAAVLAIWTLTVPARDGSPEMRITTIDGRDFMETNFHKRNVVVTMSMGPVDKPIWEGVISTGTHSLQTGQ